MLSVPFTLNPGGSDTQDTPGRSLFLNLALAYKGGCAKASLLPAPF